MIEYEVDLRVDRALQHEYLPWLRAHVAQMLALPGFLDASIHAVEVGTDQPMGYRVRYRLRDRAALDAYFEQHAARMRADGVARFGDRVSASRSVMVPLQQVP